MRKLLARLFDIREGEGSRAWLMFTYIFLLIASLMIVKPVRNSLFLTEFGARQLPYVFVLVAIFAALVVWLYSRVSARIRLDHLIGNTLFVSTGLFFFFWLHLRAGDPAHWLVYAFYIWVSIFGLLSSTQFWLLANYVFNAREARRLFGLVGAGGISGAIFGGYLTNYLAPRLSTENLIFICMGMLAMCLVLSRRAWRMSARKSYLDRTQTHRPSDHTEASDSPVRLIVGSRHLTYMAGIVATGVIVASLVDYQFSAVASQVITDTDSLTAFFGFWMSGLSLLSLGVQLLFTGRIMKHLGVVTSLFFLPAGILVGAAAVLLVPALWSAILIKVSDGALKQSVNKAGVELLALPILPRIKDRAKAFIDVFVDNLATGLAGLILIALTTLFDFSVQHISLVVMGFIAAWIYMLLRVKHEYVNSFRLAVERRSIDVEQQSLHLQDASFLSGLTRVLEGDNQRQILYVLNLLEDTHEEKLIPYLKRLAKHPSREIRAQVLKMSQQYDKLDLSGEAAKLIHSQDETVRTEAVRYLCEHCDDRHRALMGYLNHEDYRIRGAALTYAASRWKESRRFRVAVDLKSLIGDMLKTAESPSADEDQRRFSRIKIAEAVGVAGDRESCSHLVNLLDDPSLEVVQAAVVSAGRTRAWECFRILVQHLGKRNARKYAREALAGYGEEAIDKLAPYLEDPSEKREVRESIPGVLTLIGSQKSVDLLMRNLEQEDLSLRYQVVKALNKLRITFPALKSNKTLIEGRILDETRHHYRNLTLLCRERSEQKLRSTGPEAERGGAKARQLLIRALEERLDDNLERVFRLLGLRYQPRDMYDAYLAVTSGKSATRANAVEFLDNILKPDLRKVIIPMVEALPPDALVDRMRQLFGLSLPSEEESIRLLLEGDDNWLKVCALYFVAEMNYRQLLDMIPKLTDDPDPLVTETAKYCLDRMNRSY